MKQRFFMATSLALVLAGGASFAQSVGFVQASTQLLSADGGRIVFSGPSISAIGSGWSAPGVTNHPELATVDRLVVDIAAHTGCEPRLFLFETSTPVSFLPYNAFIVRQAPAFCPTIEAVTPSPPDSQRPPRFRNRVKSAILGDRG